MQNAKCKITDETSGLTVGATIGRPLLTKTTQLNKMHLCTFRGALFVFIVAFYFKICYSNCATQKSNIDTKRMFLIKVHSQLRYFFWYRFLCSNKTGMYFLCVPFGAHFLFLSKLKEN